MEALDLSIEAAIAALKGPETDRPKYAKQFNKLMEQASQTPNIGLSSYQQYVNRWQNFLTSIGSEVDLRG